MKLLITLSAGFLLFFLLRLSGRLIRLAPLKKSMHKTLLRSFPVLEFVSWVIYAFWASSMIFGDKAFFPTLQTAIIIMLLLALGWFLLRDFIAGIVLKTENAFELNENIKTSFAEGRLVKLGNRSLEIESDTGERIRLPYSRLSNELIVRMPRGGNFLSHEMLLKVSKSIPQSSVQEQLRVFILSQPWTAIQREPVIKVAAEEEQDTTYKIQFFTFSPKHASIMEDQINKLFEA